MNCPKCGEYNPSGSLVCGNCRCSLSEHNRPKTKNKISYFVDGQTFCANEMYSEALECFSKSAELGYSRAYTELGDMYYYGRGVTVDYCEAAKWYQKAIDEGETDPYEKLAVMYHHGKGVEQDINKAVRFYRDAIAYYKVALEMQCVWAAEKLGNLYEVAPEGIKSYNMAMQYYEKAAEMDSTDATIYEKLGLAFGKGIGRPINNNKAFQYYKKAIEYGCNNGEVYCNLAVLYQNGEGGEENPYMAKTYYNKAISLGYVNAEAGYKEVTAAIKKTDEEIKAGLARLQAYNAQYETSEQEEWQRRLTRTCPRCGRNSGHPIDEFNRKTSIAFWGFASNKWGKSYKCSSCNYMW